MPSRDCGMPSLGLGMLLLLVFLIGLVAGAGATYILLVVSLFFGMRGAQLGLLA